MATRCFMCICKLNSLHNLICKEWTQWNILKYASQIHLARHFHTSKLKLRIQFPEEKEAIPVYEYATKTSKNISRIYVWGFAAYGALGKSSYVKPKGKGQKPLISLHNPCRSSFADLHDVIDVACGYGFTVFAVASKNEHKVFGTGINTDSQIGYHDVRKGHHLEFLLSPVPIAIPFSDPLHTKVKHVSCGRAHTIVVTDSKDIFSLGNNAYGQCGRPIVENEKFSGNPLVQKVYGLEGSQIKKVVCGQDHTLFLTTNGEVYSCGWGADGQTGLGHFTNVWQPTKVEGDILGENIIFLSSFGDCVLAVSDKGELFGWGNSEYRQLGSSVLEQQSNIPRHISFKNVGKIVEVAAAGSMCALVNDKGNVFVWGYGLLGLGPEARNKTIPEQIPETLFGKNDFNPDVCVKHIACGLNHFAAITDKGDLFMWGKNNKNCLGLGKKLDQYFPLRVCMPAEVKDVRCGVDHTVAICKAYI